MYRRGHDYKHNDLININESTYMIEIQRKLENPHFSANNKFVFFNT